MRKIGRLVFTPNKVYWGSERFSFIIYKYKGNYSISVGEKHKKIRKLLKWNNTKLGLVDMMKIIHGKRFEGGKITINTIPQKVMDIANKELILREL